MKTRIDPFDYSREILKALPRGILLCTKAGDKINAMTIGWGMLGIEWGVPVFITDVREGRFTRELLDRNPEFVISVPRGDAGKKITAFCGTRSGRGVDKIKELGLTLVDPEVVSVPAIRELPITLECRVVYRQLQDRSAIPARFVEKYYPENLGSECCGSNRDMHVAYYGEIVSAYIID